MRHMPHVFITVSRFVLQVINVIEDGSFSSTNRTCKYTIRLNVHLLFNAHTEGANTVFQLAIAVYLF